jgi:hypothetical protein
LPPENSAGLLMLRILLCILLIYAGCYSALAQYDSAASKNRTVLSPVDPKTVNPFLSDQAFNANRQKFLRDSIAMAFLIPDSARVSQLWQNVLKNDFYTVVEQSSPIRQWPADLKSGRVHSYRPAWIIAVLVVLLLYTGALNLFPGADVKSVLTSFYNKNALSQTDKEAGLINSRAFIALFLLFCLTLGLVVFQLTQYYGSEYSITGFQLFVTMSFAAGLLLAVKFLLLRVLGFIFDISEVVTQYIAVLNLTYFNVAFVLLCADVCFSLLASRFIPTLLTVTVVLTGIVFVWQYIRNSLNIISAFRFQKFYLFVYLCALEICPILVLIKALNV